MRVHRILADSEFLRTVSRSCQFATCAARLSFVLILAMNRTRHAQVCAAGEKKRKFLSFAQSCGRSRRLNVRPADRLAAALRGIGSAPVRAHRRQRLLRSKRQAVNDDAPCRLTFRRRQWRSTEKNHASAAPESAAGMVDDKHPDRLSGVMRKLRQTLGIYGFFPFRCHGPNGSGSTSPTPEARARRKKFRASAAPSNGISGCFFICRFSLRGAAKICCGMRTAPFQFDRQTH